MDSIETGSYVRIDNSDVRGVTGLTGTVVSTDVTTCQVMIAGADRSVRVAVAGVTEVANPAVVGCHHFLSHGLSETYACGADAVGRRHSDQTDPANTNCRGCRQTDAWQDAVV